jgi:RimJ/RimL family protein N-acetyltransferase
VSIPTRVGDKEQKVCEDAHVHVVAGTAELITKRLRLRPWTGDDADAALGIFGQREVARWLTPAMPRVADRDEMRQLLSRWITGHDEAGRPLGHWAIEIRDSGLVIGAVALLPLPPGCTDLEIGWQLTPSAWGNGFGAEAGHAVAHQAFANGVSEVFAVVRLGNTRGVATARRVGMEWVGETDKYYGLTLQIYRLTAPDLDYPEPTVDVRPY